MFQRKQKSHRRYILYRIYVPIVFVAVSYLLVIWTTNTNFDAHSALSNIQVILITVLLPFVAVAGFMVTSVSVFPFEYSILGDLERTPFPNEPPKRTVSQTWGKIGNASGFASFSWYIFPSGLGVSIFGIGKVFIPAECIRSLNEDGGSFFSRFSRSRYRLVHNSPEVRSPIYLPDKELFEALGEVIGKGRSGE